MVYKPLNEMMPLIVDKFKESFNATLSEQNAGFLLCEDEKKNFSFGGSCKGNCHSAKLSCPPNWKRRLAIIIHYQI